MRENSELIDTSPVTAASYLRVIVSGILVASTLAPVTHGAHAATPSDASDQSQEIQEIVVTANRREQRLQDVGVSAAIESGAALRELSIARPEDLVRLVPGLTSIPNSGSAATSYAIRGVGQSDFSEHQEQPVAVYQDGVYVALSSATGFPVFDTQRVEVLRGPQGTLFGRNATGGLIQFYSNAPTKDFEAGTSLTEGDRNLHRFEGFASGGNDFVQGRVAFYHSQQDGWVKNLNGEDLLGTNINAWRAQVRVTPSDATTISLRYEGWAQSGSGGANKALPAKQAGGYGVPIGPNENVYGRGAGLDIFGHRDASDILSISVGDAGEILKHSDTVALNVTHEIGEIALYSTSAFTHSTVTYREDSDGSVDFIQAYGDGGHQQTISQELRLAKNTGAVRWTTGLFLLNIDGTFYIHQSFPHLCDTQNPTTCSFTNNGSAVFDFVNGKGVSTADANYRLHTKSGAVFGQVEYDLTQSLTLIGGLRVTRDDQAFKYAFACQETITGACSTILGTPTGTTPIGPYDLSQSFTNVGGKAELDYKLTPDAMVYAIVSRGIKSSTYFADSAGITPANKLRILPEKLMDYEIGAKTQFFDRRLTVNAAVFHYDYKDFQTFSFNGISTSVVNLPGRSNGGELEVSGNPGAGVTGRVGLALDHFTVDNVATPNGLQTQYAINAPKEQVNWALSKEIALPDAYNLTVGYNGRYTGLRYFNIVNEPITSGPALTLHDATLNIARGPLSVTAFCTNFTDKRYSTINFDQSFEGFYLQHPGEPRAFGMTVGYRF